MLGAGTVRDSAVALGDNLGRYEPEIQVYRHLRRRMDEALRCAAPPSEGSSCKLRSCAEDGCHFVNDSNYQGPRALIIPEWYPILGPDDLHEVEVFDSNGELAFTLRRLQ